METWAILISLPNIKTAVTGVPFNHTVFLVVWDLFRYDPHKDFFSLFNYLAQSFKDPRESKQSFYHSITVCF